MSLGFLADATGCYKRQIQRELTNLEKQKITERLPYGRVTPGLRNLARSEIV